MLKKPNENGLYKLVNQKTGKIKILKHYKNGVMHGKFVYYWDNGQIHLTGQYQCGPGWIKSQNNNSSSVKLLLKYPKQTIILY